MSDNADMILDFLQRIGVEYRLAEHAPASTMADCAAVDERLGALTPKNLFLTTKNRSSFYLCLTRPNARFRTADISRQAGSSRLSFAEEALLWAKLRCRPGSASPLGLIFPEARDVSLLVDAGLRAFDTLGFHPCDNTRTVALSCADFFNAFLPAVGVEPFDVEIHDFEQEVTTCPAWTPTCARAGWD